MRVTWLIACEQVLILSDKVSFMNAYVSEIPFRGPGIGMPFAVFMSLAPTQEELPPQDLTLRILSEEGQPVAKMEGKLPAAAPGRAGNAIVEGFLSVDEPGRYSLEILFDETPLDDAPSWELNVVQK